MKFKVTKKIIGIDFEETRKEYEKYQMEHAVNFQKIGELVKSRRKQLFISQSNLAKACNVSLTFIFNLEKGKINVHLNKLLIIFSLLGIEFNINGINITNNKKSLKK